MKIFYKLMCPQIRGKKKGFELAFREIFPIESSNGDVRLEYIGYELHEAEAPLNDELECKKEVRHILIH